MGYQNMNDNTGIDSNRNNNEKSTGRTSNASKWANDTSKCQYDRLTDSGLPVKASGPKVGTGTI